MYIRIVHISRYIYSSLGLLTSSFSSIVNFVLLFLEIRIIFCMITYTRLLLLRRQIYESSEHKLNVLLNFQSNQSTWFKETVWTPHTALFHTKRGLCMQQRFYQIYLMFYNILNLTLITTGIFEHLIITYTHNMMSVSLYFF